MQHVWFNALEARWTAATSLTPLLLGIGLVTLAKMAEQGKHT